MFISITGVTPDNKLSKYQNFDSEAAADVHAAKYDGFVVENPGGNDKSWVVDAVKKTVTRDVAAESADRDARTAQRVQMNRRAAYQSEADPLYFEEQRGEVAAGTWTAKVAEIKARFPK